MGQLVGQVDETESAILGCISGSARDAALPADSAGIVIALPPILDAREAQNLRQAVLASNEDRQTIVIDGSAVERASSACLQVLLAAGVLPPIRKRSSEEKHSHGEHLHHRSRNFTVRSFKRREQRSTGHSIAAGISSLTY